jgi:ankyrin repeat protein
MGVVRVLLANGADLESKDERGATPLIIGVEGHNTEIVKLLLEKGANISARDNYEGTALTEASRSFDPEMLRAVLEGNPDIEDKNAALLQAAKSGPVAIQAVDAPSTAARQDEPAARAPQELPWVKNVRLLLDGGANIEARDEEGSTPLMQAAAFGQTETFKFLVERGAKINVRDKRGMSPLTAAACACAIATMNSTFDIVRLLLEKGANVNAYDHDGRTALMMAAGSPDGAPSVSLLLSYGANAMVKDNKGRTALDFAKDSPFPEKAKQLKKAMAKSR